MIPVRVPADCKPVLASERRFRINGGHPLYRTECAACGELLRAGDTVVLIVAGIAPGSRKPEGFATGGAVAVHEGCAGA